MYTRPPCGSGALVTFVYWGWIGLVLGLILLVGVVPMGFLALILQSEWKALVSLLSVLGFGIFARFAGRLISDAPQD